MYFSRMNSDRPPGTPSSMGSLDFLNDVNEKMPRITHREISAIAKIHRAAGKKQSLAPSMGSTSGRLQRIELLERYLEQHNSPIVKLAVENLQFAADPFGMNILFDKDKDEKNNRGCRAIYQYLAYLHKKFGLRHILLLLLLIGYTLIGGLIFDAIESPYETQQLQNKYNMLMQRIDNVSEEILSLVLSTNDQTNRKDDVDKVVKKFYKDMLDLEGILLDSVFDKADNNRTVWNFGSAVFYATALYTTTGYGTIVCASNWGKAFTVIYATIGLPLILVVLNDLGRVLLFALQKVYNRVYRMCRKSRMCREIDEEGENVEHTFPLRLAIPLVVLYLLVCALVVHVFDYQLRGEDEKGLNFGNSFYFAFISMTTIGLGDVMPVNIQYSPFVATMFMFGLVLFSVINSTIYMRMERNYFRAMEAMESVLDELHGEKIDDGNHGYRVFRVLSDAIRLAALIVPEFYEEGRHNLDTIPDSLRASQTSRRSLLSLQRLRIKRQSAGSINSQMTLGVMGLNLDAVRSKFSEFNEMEKTNLERSRAMSRSDTDLFSNQRHVMNRNDAVVNFAMPPESRFYLDTVREVNELNDLTQERSAGDILRSRITSHSDADLLFDPRRRSLSLRISDSFRRVEPDSDL